MKKLKSVIEEIENFKEEVIVFEIMCIEGEEMIKLCIKEMKGKK